ncbi:GNAT family N-acetyltransferase [Synechococcus sp. EJ6-Ellesmere]|uniref:GNAT family N-acetyltransferase n=1 Tax=Synechococcus sp. EJ6-Ellesmere TaxID=2823734 RepID=UPI0020CB91BD|nr:GNAT family N-acetyltransferase [Synechococcus sp. EJ6-Ellesmere]MCP9824141.1 GNAT family N-acetyltransferase [Synechococcus sp. EJ6-Ellesmere]
MSGNVQLIRHRAGALRLRWLPGHLRQLQQLFDQHSSWAQGRSMAQLRRMLASSQMVVSAWSGGRRRRLVGFGRASSDGVFRAVLWDVVVAKNHQGQGVGRQLVQALLASRAVAEAERIYLMTTSGNGFYARLGFEAVQHQQLMLHQQRSEAGNAGAEHKECGDKLPGP